MLPLNRSSSVFVQVDESNCFMWRALITGPEDTPYSGGCFIFDIWFPGQYPCVPPQVRKQMRLGIFTFTHKMCPIPEWTQGPKADVLSEKFAVRPIICSVLAVQSTSWQAGARVKVSVMAWIFLC